jgi:hypothetical protein
MSFETNLGLGIGIAGSVASIVSLVFYFKERREKGQLKVIIDGIKNDSFVQNITKGLEGLAIVHQISGLNPQDLATQLSSKYLISYLNATNTNDQSNILDLWEKIAYDIGRMIDTIAKQNNTSVPSGLAEYITYSFLSEYSTDRAKKYLISVVVKNSDTEQNFVRYYLSARSNPKSISDIISKFDTFSKEEIESVLVELKGQVRERMIKLFSDDKWNRRVIDRLRDFVDKRNMSYNSIVGKLLETNPVPKLYFIFKNEGKDPDPEDGQANGKIVYTKLTEMKNRGEISAVTNMASIYFGRDADAIKKFLESLPSGVENNYVVFIGEVDPLTMNVKNSDRLDGKPELLYMNLQKFRELKNIYEGIIVKLGLRPSEFIETADIGFLFETKNTKITEALRTHSDSIKKELSERIGRTIAVLTELRHLDEDDIGQFGSIISKKCGLPPSTGRDIATKMVDESKELHNSIYGNN